MFKSINGGKLPTRGSKYSAGVDVYANEDVTIGAGETAIVGLGITIDDTGLHKTILSDFGGMIEHSEIDRIETYKKWFLSSHYIALNPQRSLRAKGLISHSAVINLNYKDEIKMIIHNPVINIYSMPIIIADEDYIGDEYHMGDKYIVEGSGDYSDGEYHINKGDRIGQLLLMEHKSYLFGIDK